MCKRRVDACSEPDFLAVSGRAVKVPSGRAARLAHLGSLSLGMMGNVAGQGLKELGSGRRPALPQLLMSPQNITLLARKLAKMRGAAMKLGQLLSMDSGDFLPSELAMILQRLRAEADFMPPKQLRDVLNQEWGMGWMGRFSRFDVRPMAAASIGQVHYAVTKAGEALAIKVQYPGVRNSIDSDIENVSALIAWSGLLPPGLDLGPFLTLAKEQLHEETDYAREAKQLLCFGDLLSGDTRFAVPQVHADLSTENILAMEFMPGQPIEDLLQFPTEDRRAVMEALIDLSLKELFDFKLMQTDPNFANFLYDAKSKRVVLLDFGATRPVNAALSAAYARYLNAGLAGQETSMCSAALTLGFLNEAMPQSMQDEFVEMMHLAFAELAKDKIFQFGQNELAHDLQQRGLQMAERSREMHLPPPETLYIQRKMAGLYLLGRRLKAEVDLQNLLKPYLHDCDQG